MTTQCGDYNDVEFPSSQINLRLIALLSVRSLVRRHVNGAVRCGAARRSPRCHSGNCYPRTAGEHFVVGTNKSNFDVFDAPWKSALNYFVIKTPAAAAVCRLSIGVTFDGAVLVTNGSHGRFHLRPLR